MTINNKYYDDIGAFGKQFGHQYGVTLPAYGQIDRIVICGMGGSSLHVPLLNQLLACVSSSQEEDHGGFRQIDVCRGYRLHIPHPSTTLVVCISYSGGTEETLHCYDVARDAGAPIVVMTTGGELGRRAAADDVPLYEIPASLQARLSTGYFFAATLDLLTAVWGVGATLRDRCIEVGNRLDPSADPSIDAQAQAMAAAIGTRVPIIYAPEEVGALAQIIKIKFNENAKTQSFRNEMPELCHNEMSGFDDMVMEPYFILLDSPLTHPQNSKRYEIFAQIMAERDIPVQIVQMQGDDRVAQTFATYILMDYVTYYVADAKGVDPEPVPTVIAFKEILAAQTP